MRPYKKGDIYQVDLAEYEQKYIDYFGYEGIEDKFYSNWGYSLFGDNRLIGCGGIYIYWEGVAEVWLFLSKQFKEHFTRPVIYIKKYLNELAKENNIWRLQASICADLPINQRFIEWLGFHKEGVQEKYGPWKDDHILYSRII